MQMRYLGLEDLVHDLPRVCILITVVVEQQITKKLHIAAVGRVPLVIDDAHVANWLKWRPAPRGPVHQLFAEVVLVLGHPLGVQGGQEGLQCPWRAPAIAVVHVFVGYVSDLPMIALFEVEGG